MHSPRSITTLLFSLLLLGSNSCDNECGDPGYLGLFYLTDKKTGKPYYQVSADKPDSLRVYTDGPSGSQLAITPTYSKEYGYIFGAIDLYGDVNYTLYIQLNRYDVDTLFISNSTTRIYGKCRTKSFLTKATYNGRLLQSISSDTTGVIAYLNLIK